MSEVKEVLQEIAGQVEETHKLGEQITEKQREAAEEISKVGEVSAENQEQLAKMQASMDAKQKDIDERLERFEKRMEEREGRKAAPQVKGGTSTAWNQVFEGDKWKNFTTDPRNRPFSLKFDESVFFGRKALVEGELVHTTGDEGLEGLKQPEYDSWIAPKYEENRIRNCFPILPTTKDTIKYTRWTTLEGGAEMVEEGCTKPLSKRLSEAVQCDVKKIADGRKVSDECLDDLPAMAQFFNVDLRNDILDLEDFQLLFGDSSANPKDIDGVFTWGTPYDIAAVPGQTPENLYDEIAIAIAQLRKARCAYPDKLIINPCDEAALKMQKIGDNYVCGMPCGQGDITPHGVRIVTSTFVQPGQFALGNFRQAANFRPRKDITIEVFNQNEDDARRDLLYFRAEERFCLTPRCPQCVVVGTFGGGAVKATAKATATKTAAKAA